MMQRNVSILSKVSNALKANRFDVCIAENRKAAKEIMLDMIPLEADIGVGDSATLRQIEVIDELAERGSRIFNPFIKELTTIGSRTEVREAVVRQCLRSDVFIVSSNAVTLDGKIVNIDHVGNRVAAMIHGPEKVIIVVGQNKIVKDVDEAIYRIKNIIAPYHCRCKKIPTPCAKTLKCSDCNTPRRICNVTTILEKRPRRTNTTVILVEEDLGLGWDQSWTKTRIDKIKSNYERVTWQFTFANR